MNTKPGELSPTPFSQAYFHGTKAELEIGHLIDVGFNSNYGQRNNSKYIFLTSTLDAAIWGAELMSYRAQYPFRVVGEITVWQSHLPDQVTAMKDGLAKLKERGINSLND